MNIKRLLAAWVAVFVTYQLLNYVFHQVLMADTYGANAAAFRPEAEMMASMWVMMVTAAVWCGVFCYVFVKGREHGGVMEGARYGLLMGLFIGAPFAYESWVLYPLPLSMAHAWFVGTLVIGLLCGIVAALVYRPLTPASA